MGADAVRIRPFVKDDEAAVVALWREAFPEEPPRNEPRALIARKLTVQPELFLVAETQGRVAGTVIAGFDGYRGWVYHLAVEARSRRRGLGRALMREAETRLSALGCPKLNLQVRSTNPGVIAFYRRIGYELEERVSFGKVLGG